VDTGNYVACPSKGRRAVSKTLAELEEKVLPLAIAAGAGLSVDDITALCDVATQTYYNRQSDPDAKTYFERWKAFTSTAVEKEVERRVRKIEASVSAEQRMSDVFLRALTLSEKRLKRAEELGDEITDDELKAIHKDFTRWAAPWAASQAPKRIEMGGTVSHVHTLVDETVNRIAAFAEKYQGQFLPPADVVEADVVS
jgi:hypothetical protein